MSKASPQRLPRLDWLLLLLGERPECFARALALGGGTELTRALRVIGGADRVDDQLPAPGEPAQYDLVVVIEPADSEPVGRALAVLRPGGIAYVQTRRGKGLPASAARRMLEGAGLGVRGQWAMLPGPEQPKRYLPVGSASPWRWYLRNLFLASTPRLRAQSLGLRVLAHSATLVRRMAPGIATLGVRPDPVPADATPAQPLQTAGRELVPVLITSGYDSGSRAVILPFQAGSPWPAEVVKVARRAELRDATRLEHTRLIQLRRELPTDLVRALPIPYGLVEAERSTAARQAAARGPLMLLAAAHWPRRQRLAERDLSDIGCWLADLHNATAVAAAGSAVPAGSAAASTGTQWLLEPLERLHGLTNVAPSITYLVTAAAAELDRGPHVPAVVQHYDVGPWNIVRERDGFTLLDWELDLDAGRTGWGPPVVDFVYFASSWYNLTTRRLTRGEEIDGLLEAFAGRVRRPGTPAWPLQVLTRQCEAYLRRTGLAPEALQPLVVACWLERAVTAHSRWQRLREGEPDAKGLEFLAALAGQQFLVSPAAVDTAPAAARLPRAR